MTPGERLRSDVARVAKVSLAAVAVLALFEWGMTIAGASGPVRFATMLRFFALTIALMGILWVIVFAGAAVVTVALGFVRPRRDEAPAVEPGLQPRAAALWGGALAAAIYVGLSVVATLWFIKRFKAPIAIAFSLALVQLALFAVAFGLHRAMSAGFRRAARALEPGLGRWNPFGRVRVALIAWVVLLVPVMIFLRRLPQLRDAFPWRLATAAIVLGAAAVLLAPLVTRRPLPRAKIAVPAAILVWLGITAASLTSWGANDEVKALTSVPSTPTYTLVKLVRAANDFDGDGYGTLLGENDCAPWNARRNPNAREIPDNGIDENCNGTDSTKNAPPSYKKGQRVPVPEQWARGDWNFLLITIDTVRYDHTTMGGYKEKKGRDTTPRLAELARRSVNFAFANAPSAGTMASVPAILTSKFFHSGIALGPERRPMPPKILPENTTIAEVLKRAGYRTGAILTHEYFNDWGLDQGMDSYDNALGEKPNPERITSEEVTNKAQQWIARQGNDKWFLWAHYIDPHGKYMPHPGETEYGTTEEDLYDGELAYTDKHIGRLMEWLGRSQAGKRTIIIVTSDHGDGFGEHGFINHGMALYKELLHVPLIFYVPDVDPKTIEGPVSPIDILPTVADIAGVDISDLAVEGESLVAQIFYGKDAKDRVVFAETNFPDPLRAAITNDHKLVYNLKSNHYQLFDLRADPWEKKNIWSSNKVAADKVKAIMDEWLDRVYFSRDATNQAQQKRANVLLPGPPAPKNAAKGTFAGVIEALGWDAKKVEAVPGEDLKVTVYLKSVAATPAIYKVELEATPQPAAAPPAPQPRAARKEQNPGDGTFPTTRWRPGEFIKLDFNLKIPRDWQGQTAVLKLRLLDEKRQPAPIGDGTTQLVLGELPLAAAPPLPAPAPTQPTQPAQPGLLRPQPTPGKPLPVQPRPTVRVPGK